MDHRALWVQNNLKSPRKMEQGGRRVRARQVAAQAGLSPALLGAGATVKEGSSFQKLGETRNRASSWSFQKEHSPADTLTLAQ